LLASLPGGDGLRADSLLASVEFSLRSPRLKTSGHQLFALLGQLPAGLAEDDADAIAGIDASEGAAQLRSVGLLRDLGGARIGLLPPIRDLALRRFRPAPAVQTAWIGHYLGLLEAASPGLGNANNKIAVKRLAPEMPNIGAAIQTSPHTELGLAAVRPVLKPFENAVAYTGFAAEPTYYNLHAACVATGDRIGQGICLFNIGNRARLRAHNETATQALLQALDCLKDSAEFRTTGLCYWSLAEIATTSGNHPRAAECYALGQTCFQHGNWLPGEADCLSGLASLADLHDEYAKATVLYEEASRLFLETNRIRSHADTLWYMGEMERVREKFPHATALFEKAMDIYKDLDYAWGICDTLRSLAHLAAMMRDFASARLLLQRSREDLPSIPDYTVTNLLFVEAEIERLQGQPQTAEPLYQSALGQFRSYEYLRGLADCEYGLGECARMRRNAATAGSHYHAASAHYQNLGNLIGQANCLAGLADLAVETDAAAARQHGRKAIALYHSAGATHAAERRSKAGFAPAA
jgi:tetratricopeptide (TPR) repeat protein